MNPEYSSNAFYDAPHQGPGLAERRYRARRPGGATQRRRHGIRPTRGQGPRHGLGPGRLLPAGIGCRLEAPTTAGSASAVADLISQDHGLTARVEGDTVVLDAQTSEQAWAVGAWGVARAIDTGSCG